MAKQYVAYAVDFDVATGSREDLVAQVNTVLASIVAPRTLVGCEVLFNLGCMVYIVEETV